MLLMAVVTFTCNMTATKLLHVHSKESMNIRSAFLHSLQDALFLAGVIVAAILVIIFNWQWADAGISLILSVLLAKEAISLVLETVHVLMEGAPTNLDIDKLKQDILALPKIKSISDLHVWSTGSKEIILTAHVAAKIISEADYSNGLKSIQKLIRADYGITHFTIQLVPVGVMQELKDICQHCSEK